MSEKQKTKSASRRRSASKDLQLPDELQSVFDDAVKEAAGHRLSMEPGSPLGRLIGSFVEHALKVEMDEHLGYEPRKRDRSGDQLQSDPGSARRENTRNGYANKQLKTSVGSTAIAVPRDRAALFAPEILPKHGAMSDEISERVIAMYASGMTTRDIAQHVRELYHFSASENFVSRIVETVEPELVAWRNRPLESIYAVVYLDGLHLKVRHQHGVKSTACYVVTGYAESGRHEVLGIWIAPTEDSIGESAGFWQTVLLELQQRGADEILIMTTDGLTGLEQAVSAVYPTAEHIPCVVHLMRSSLASVGAKAKREVAAALKQIYQAPSYQAAEAAFESFKERFGSRHGLIVRQWQQAMPRLAVLWGYPPELRQMVYTTNPQENINRQIRKVTKNRGLFPSIDSALRLMTLVLIEIDRRANRLRRHRRDWQMIVEHLHIRYAGRLPEGWGLRH
jgi:transposase-like protein